jgi:flagellar biosynthetic protein FlhB
MADDTDLDQRTERATQKRLQEARDQGRLPRSRELSIAVTLGSSVLFMMMAGGALSRGAQSWMHAALQPNAAADLAPAQMLGFAGAVATRGFMLVSPLLVGSFVAALLAPLLLGGWTFSTHPLMPDFSRIDPLKGLARMFSLNGAVEVVKALAKAGLIFAVGGGLLWSKRNDLLALGDETLASGLGQGLGISLQLLAEVGGTMLAIAALDIGYQLWNYQRQMRMTREELREESKESEGRPEVKARVRKLQSQLATRRMMQAIPKADVVVTNPTHFAVALQYTEGRMRAPKVIAKGAGEVAAKIREIAAKHRVPLMSSPPLARSLYRYCEIGAEIPVQLYQAVAQVLTYVYQLKRRISGVLPEPKIEVPPEVRYDPAE